MISSATNRSAMTTSARESASTARSVTNPGSPGPAPTRYTNPFTFLVYHRRENAASRLVDSRGRSGRVQPLERGAAPRRARGRAHHARRRAARQGRDRAHQSRAPARAHVSPEPRARARHDLPLRPAREEHEVLDEEYVHSARHDLHRAEQAGDLRRGERRAAHVAVARPRRRRVSVRVGGAGGVGTRAWSRARRGRQVRRHRLGERRMRIAIAACFLLSSAVALADTAAGAGDPVANHTISIEDATKGLKGSGPLSAKIEVEQSGKVMGTFTCELFDKQAP